MNNYGNNFFGALPAATKNLLIITALVWLAQLLMPRYGVDLSRWFALHYPASAHFLPFQFVTYMFMHGSWAHIFVNMFGLYMLGTVINQMWGTKRFLTFYFVTGIGAGFIHLLATFIRIQIVEANMPPEMIQMVYAEGTSVINRGMRFIDNDAQNLNRLIHTSAVGASGAISGILIAFAMLFPTAPLYIMFIPIPIKAKHLVIVLVLASLFFGFANFPGDRIAHFAHLGGMLFGLILILYWRKTDKNRNYYEHYY